jgi:hypothetical protein
MINNMGQGHLPPFSMVNMLIVGRAPDRPISTLALKRYATGEGMQLYTDDSEMDNRNIDTSVVVFNHEMVSRGNKSHSSCKCKVDDAEIFAIMERLWYLVGTWDEESPHEDIDNPCR